MKIKSMSSIVFGIMIACVQVGCIEPSDDLEPVARATSAPAEELSAVATESPAATMASSYMCRYLCPEIPRIFNGFSNYPAQACLKAESACLASCLSCEFFEIISRP